MRGERSHHCATLWAKFARTQVGSSLREHPVFVALVSPAFGGEKRQPEIRLLKQAKLEVILFCSEGVVLFQELIILST